MSLADCFAKAGKALSGQDRSAIESLVADGMSEQEAVDSYLATLDDEIRSVTDRIAEAGGTVVLQQKSNLGLYSAVGNVVREMSIPAWKKPDGSARGSDIWSKIKSSQVKKEEAQWLGVEEFLTVDPNAKFTRDQVVQYIDDNGIHIEEVVADEESTGEDSIEWNTPEVWDDPEAWGFRAEDILYEFDNSTEYDGWMEGWITNNPDAVVDNYYHSLPDDQRAELDELDTAAEKVQWINDNVSDAIVVDDMKSQARDEFEEWANEVAEEEYRENPIYIQEASNVDDLYIFGNDDQGYDIRHGDWSFSGNVVRSDIWSEGEAEIQANQFALEEGLLDSEHDVETVKWADHITDGYADNYREIKLTLPEIKGDFYEDAHFPDRNLLAFLRVTDRELETGLEIEGDPYESKHRIDYRFVDNPVKGAVHKRIVEYFDLDTGDVLGTMTPNGSMSEDEFIADAREKTATAEAGKRVGKLTTLGDGTLGILKDTPTSNTYFIDEFQSDWHQQGRQRGYATGEVDAGELEGEANDLIYELTEDLGVNLESYDVLKSLILGKNDEEVAEDKIVELSQDPSVISRVKNIESMHRRVQAERHGVPDAPFKGDAWMALGLKRAIVDAAENGYDSIAWANAPVLMDRWSERYETLYRNQYDKKMPSIVKKLTKQQPVQLTLKDGLPVEHEELGYWIIPITDELRAQATEQGFTLFQPTGTELKYDTNIPSRQRDQSISEQEPSDRQPVQIELFVEPDSSEQETREQLADIYATLVESEQVRTLDTATDVVSTPEDLAHIVSDIGRHAQETFMAIVTGADGKVLRVIRHSKGQKASASVDPLTVIAEVASIEGADTVHYAHNHPSGSLEPSSSDEMITERLNALLDGTGIDSGFHVIVAGVSGKASVFGEGGAADFDIPVNERTKSIDVTERMINKQGFMGPPITKPKDAKDLVDKIESDNALVLLNNNNAPVGTVFLSDSEMATLRDNGQVNRIFKAINATNASAAIIKYEDADAARNLSKFINTFPDFKLLDAFGSDGASDAIKGGDITGSAGLFRQGEDQSRGTIKLMPDGQRIIQLGKLSDPSTFAHELGHLFLEMEQQFADEFGITEDQQTILDWMNVDSFNDITVEHHEKWAETFEVYLEEGKAPSLALRDVFASFRRWLTAVYRSLDPRDRADLTPEIQEVFDRLLATEEEIDAMTANPAFDQFFKSKEQAGMTDLEWDDYQKRKERAKSKSQSTIDQKIISELKRRKTAEWDEEKAPIVDEEKERLSNLPVYRILEVAKDEPMDRDAVFDILGIGDPKKLTKEEIEAARRSVKPDDSLLIAAARKGGLDMSHWEREGVDPEYLKDRAFNNRIFGLPIFRKSQGMTADDLAEFAVEYGYMTEFDANAVLDLVMRELGGDPVLTPEGIVITAEADYTAPVDDYTEYVDHQAEKDRRKSVIAARKFAYKFTAKGGLDPAEYAEVYGYVSADEMLEAIKATPPLNEAAELAAENRMIGKHGDMLNDGSIEREARDAIHNDEQAKLLLVELKSLGRRVGARDGVNREYLKAQAKTMIGSMKYSEIAPSKFYRAELRAAQKAVTATNDKDAYNAKIQQIANHYLYRESVITRDVMKRQRQYVRKVQTRKYNEKSVHPSYISKLKMVANMYDLRTNPERVNMVSDVINWYQGQMSDKTPDLSLIDENLILALAAKERSNNNQVPADMPLPTFDDLTADQLRGLYDQLRHLRFIGGQLSDEVAFENAKVVEESYQSIIDNGGRDQKGERGIPGKREQEGRQLSHLVNKLPSLMNLVRKLDGWTEDGQGVMFNNLYQRVVDGNNAVMNLEQDFFDKFKTELHEINNIGITRNDSKTYRLSSGRDFSIHTESRFMMGLYWGVESSRDAIREGYGLSDTDVEMILSDLTDHQLDVIESVWSMNESIWPLLASAGVKRYGVAPPKLDPAPFTINGRVMKGGHMRLFYDSTRIEVKNEQEMSSRTMEVMPSKAGSLHTRVGSGGNPVLLDVNNIARAMKESVHFIAFAEPAADIRRITNNDRVKGAIERKHGVGFYRALVENIESVTTNRHVVERFPWIAAGLRHLRKAVSYQYIVLNYRNVTEQSSALPMAMNEVGATAFADAAARIVTNPDLTEWIRSQSPYMNNRASVVNKVASDYFHHLSVGDLNLPVAPGKSYTLPTKISNAYRYVEEHGYALQTYMDALMAYPVWLAKYEQVMGEMDPNANEAVSKRHIRSALTLADQSVAESVGSGSNLHLGGLYQSTNQEWVQFFTMMGSWFNNQYNRVYRDTEGFKTFDNKQAIMSLTLIPLLSALMSAAIRMDGPDEDEELLMWGLRHYGMFLAGMVPGVRDVAAANIDKRPVSTVYEGAIGAPLRVVREVTAYGEDRQTGIKTSADLLSTTATLVPLPGSGNIVRVLDYIDSYSRGLEGDVFNPHQALAEGSDKNDKQR